jgi:hypothetical protein
MNRLLIAVIVGCTAAPPGTKSTTGTPSGEDAWTLVTSEPDSEARDGFLVLSRFDKTSSEAFVLTGEGAVVWRSHDPGGGRKINRARLALDGRSVLHAANDRERLTDLGIVTRTDLETGEVLSETRTVEQHHDFVERPDTNAISWLSWGYGEARLGLSPIPLATDVLRTAPEGSSEEAPTQIFDFLTDYPEPPFWSCAHMGFDHFAPNHYEWSHSNSLTYLADEDAYFILVRYWDALLKIHGDGTLAWQLGGRFSDLSMSADDAFHHPHMSEVWPGGMLVFDNGDHSDFPVSGAVEYAWDEDTGTAWKVWEYRDPEGRFISYLGDAQRLPGGNTLIAWGPLGRLTEVTPQGRVVWELMTDGTVGRVTWVDHLP